jgi:hypothetical protein
MTRIKNADGQGRDHDQGQGRGRGIETGDNTMKFALCTISVPFFPMIYYPLNVHNSSRAKDKEPSRVTQFTLVKQIGLEPKREGKENCLFPSPATKDLWAETLNHMLPPH